MKYLKLILVITFSNLMYSCGATNATANETERVEAEIAKKDSFNNPENYSDLIKTVYEKFVYDNDANIEAAAHPEEYFTANALKKLKDSYEFDCESGDCYAYNELRTKEQDSKPGSNEESNIISINRIDDNWYIVKYFDMGWSGMTRIKIVGGKIDDFERCVEDL